MICFLVTAAHRYTFDRLLAARQGQLPVEIVPITYTEVHKGRRIPPGTVIFTDFDRLTSKGRMWAANIWVRLSRSGGQYQLLNHPMRAMRRYEMLRELSKRGINRHNVYRLTDTERPQRYPVFIRKENDHNGSETSLLLSPEELEAAVEAYLAKAPEAGNSARMIVEFNAAADERGYYHVYSAQRIGEAIIPRTLAFSKNWIVKRSVADPDRDLLAKEREFLATNPHEAFIRQVFDIARIEYGRIDYTVVDGRPQAYEINTNPQLYFRSTTKRHATHFPDLPSAVDRMLAAFAALDARLAPVRDAAPPAAEG